MYTIERKGKRESMSRSVPTADYLLTAIDFFLHDMNTKTNYGCKNAMNTFGTLSTANCNKCLQSCLMM